MGRSLLKKLLLLCVFFFMMPLRVHAKPLDEIQDEKIYIETREDGPWISDIISNGKCWTVPVRDL